MGRVRLRVRDIDYADEVKPLQPILSSPQKETASPSKKTPSSATKLKAGGGSKSAANSGGAN